MVACIPRLFRGLSYLTLIDGPISKDGFEGPHSGAVAKRPKATDCKSVIPRFESGLRPLSESRPASRLFARLLLRATGIDRFRWVGLRFRPNTV